MYTCIIILDFNMCCKRVNFYYLLKLLYIVGIYLDEYWFVGPSGCFTHIYVILNCLGQVCFLGIAPRTKETLPDFRE